MQLIDSHCHLDSDQFDADREEVIDRARAAGVSHMVAIGTGNGPPDLEAGIRLADRYEFFYATVGIHPHDASKATIEIFNNLSNLAQHNKVIAVGEIGLDYHYDFSPRDIQLQVFIDQMKIADAAKKPIVIHTREAWTDTILCPPHPLESRPGRHHALLLRQSRASSIKPPGPYAAST